MFILEHPLGPLHGADYNPRVIESDSLDKLCLSLSVLGFAKPIIITSSNLIIAGHQRCKAANRLGLATVPAYILPAEATFSDEVRFNQLHNGTDLETSDHITVPPGDILGFDEVQHSDINGNLRGEMAAVRSEICNLIIKFGGWGCAVVTRSGVVCSSGQYALACKKLKVGCRVFRIPDELEREARGFFEHTYGQFSYDHLPKFTYLQSLIQPWRLRDGHMRSNASTLYQKHVLKQLTPEKHALDFGCGQADYVKTLRANGYNICGVEFFYKDSRRIDKRVVHSMCDDLANRLETQGLFDIVICDAVINAVDSLQAEADVMTCLNAFLKVGGTLFMSGRMRETVAMKLKSTVNATHIRTLEFIDSNGLTAQYRNGGFVYYKYHTKAEATALAEKYIGPCTYYGPGGMFQLKATKTVVLDPEQISASVSREFNLPWPDGCSVNKHERVLTALRSAAASNL